MDLEKLAKLIRYYSLVSTTEAGSGHPSSSLSAADLMAVLMYGRSRIHPGSTAPTYVGADYGAGAEERNAELRGKPDEGSAFFRYDLSNPDYFNNDRLIFSKGHASPLFYALWAVAGQRITTPPPAAPLLEKEGIKRAILPLEMLTLRKFGSRLEGHPTLEFPFTEVPTGSLGQGLSVGVGMALNAKLDKLPYHTFVLLGDSEMAEGSVWEAMAVASHYKLDNLVAILDCNRLGQRGETLHGHDVASYQRKAEAFGWSTMVIDGHNLEEIKKGFEWVKRGEGEERAEGGKPKIIIAKTLKGKGVSFMEDKDGWHGKPLSREELEKALKELGEVDKSIVGEISMPVKAEFPISNFQFPINIPISNYPNNKPVATRKAYGNALVNIIEAYPNAIILDAETSNSTYAEFVKKNHPEKFVECFIAEQNMVGMALGFARRGKIPFVSTFAAFFTRAFDQIRMSQYAHPVKSQTPQVSAGAPARQTFNGIKFCGSHAGVSIGEDGASQMGLEDIAMFRTLLDSVVLYPCDAVSCEQLVWLAAKHQGNVYIRTTRKETEILYANDKNEPPPFPPPLGEGRVGVHHEFKIGGSCVLRSSDKDVATIICAGITVHEALAAHQELQKEGINIRVIDLYSIKPLDIATLQKCAKETGCVITVEDHFKEGGIGEAVAGALCTYEVHHILESLSVRKMPKSGKPEELLAFEEIDAAAIVKKVTEIISLSSRI